MLLEIFILMSLLNSHHFTNAFVKLKCKQSVINKSILSKIDKFNSPRQSFSVNSIPFTSKISHNVSSVFQSTKTKIKQLSNKLTTSTIWLSNKITKVIPLLPILFSIALWFLTKTYYFDKYHQQLLPMMISVISRQDLFIEIKNQFINLANSMHGVKLDSLILLVATSVIIPLFKKLDTSPILGFLITGTLLGPYGLKWVNDVHMIDMLGELGIVFFLFEMGLELSLDKLMSMKRDVFGLGSLQFVCTSLLAALVASFCGLSAPAAVTIGGSLALSSSAFVLQLLKDKEAMGTRYGRASFGILLLQDLAVVPLLVVVELLAKGGSGIGRALGLAAAKAFVTLYTMSFVGKRILDKVFYVVAKYGSHEAFLSSILASVLLMSFVTQGIGLSNTLGAFMAGLLLAETRYRYQIEADIAPFRGLLLGVFFITVGFSIDLKLLVQEGPRILTLLLTLIIGKASIITALSMAFGLSFDNAQQAGLLNAQAGEFAFVAFAMAERLGLLPSKLTRTLMTTVALSMAVTPSLAELGSFIARKLERTAGFTHYLGNDSDAKEMKSALQKADFVFVCGYGRVGKMVCDMLDRVLVPYICVDANPKKIIDARNRGLPVFYGDVSRPEIIRNFDAGSAKACVVAIGDMSNTNKAVVNLRRNYPNIPLLVRAKDRQHQSRLQKMFDNIQVMCPVLPDDSVVLTLPFGGAVLQTLGVQKAEADSVIAEFRQLYLNSIFDETSSFLLTLEQRLPEPETMNDEANEDLHATPGTAAGADVDESLHGDTRVVTGVEGSISHIFESSPISMVNSTDILKTSLTSDLLAPQVTDDDDDVFLTSVADLLDEEGGDSDAVSSVVKNLSDNGEEEDGVVGR